LRKMSYSNPGDKEKRLYWWEIDAKKARSLIGAKRTKKPPKKKAQWITTTIAGLDGEGKSYTLFLRAGQQVPRTRNGQIKKARKQEREITKQSALERKKEDGWTELSILKNHHFKFPFLTEKENIVFALRVAGVKRAKIAIMLSGGRRGWTVTASAVKGILGRVYKKLKAHRIGVERNGKYFRVYKG